MSQRLKFASPVVRTRAGLHADQTSWLPLKEGEDLVATQLSAHENPTVLVDAMDLKDALREVHTTVASSGMKGSSVGDNNILNYGVVHRREQEPSIPSIEQLFAKLKALLRTAAARTADHLWSAIRQAFTRFKTAECRNYLAAAGYDAYNPT